MEDDTGGGLLNREDLLRLQRLMKDINPYAKAFKSCGERVKENPNPRNKVHLKQNDPSRLTKGTHNRPTSEEVAAVIMMPENLKGDEPSPASRILHPADPYRRLSSNVPPQTIQSSRSKHSACRGLLDAESVIPGAFMQSPLQARLQIYNDKGAYSPPCYSTSTHGRIFYCLCAGDGRVQCSCSCSDTLRRAQTHPDASLQPEEPYSLATQGFSFIPSTCVSRAINGVLEITTSGYSLTTSTLALFAF